MSNTFFNSPFMIPRNYLSLTTITFFLFAIIYSSHCLLVKSALQSKIELFILIPI